MSVQQDRLTFFGVLIAVVVVVLGYLQLGKLYPVAGRAEPPAEEERVDNEREKEALRGGQAVNREDPSP